MKTHIALLILGGALLPGLLTCQAFAGADHLARQSVVIDHPRSEAVLDRTVSDLRSVFERYQPALDSSSRLVSPLKIGGTSSRPTFKMSVEKCVLFVCQVVDLDATAKVTEFSGKCKRNFIMEVDLQRSSELLTDVYDRLDATICYKETSDGKGTLDLSAEAHHAPDYSQGTIQNEIFKLLQLQIAPITKAIKETLKHNGKDI